MQRPIAGSMLVIALLVLLYPVLKWLFARKRSTQVAAA
jgi:cbb3-type cytochrome oxidase subunit 3